MGLNYQIMLKQNLQDLNPLFIGEAYCPAGVREIASARNCSVLYRIRQGSGTVRIKNVDYPVREGEFFLVPVGQLADIFAGADGWTFQWIGFNGALAYDFLQLPTVFTLPEGVAAQLYDLQDPCENIGSRVSSDLLLIHSVLTKPKPDRTDHVQRVVDRILSSYMFKLSVEEMAREMGINSCHLSRLFTKKMGCSIRQYLLTIRISNAKNHLVRGYSVKETALLCGFNDTANFSKLFKKETGFSPYRWLCEMQDWAVDRAPTSVYPPPRSFPLEKQET
ncbi:MAG: helix-turn-helix domain-containing protein [Oscillospiraceae bacterium]|nr:helix-turn-helix domain-containing protein [Oscillospiraceae bacterium]